MPRAFPVVVGLSLAWLASTAGCGHNIGDPCSVNIDCSTAGDRFCDTASIGGYCTVDGCDVGTCPDNQLCVRFLTVIKSETCDFVKPPETCMPGQRCCAVDERCVCDVTDDKNVCKDNLGHCAPESSERRWCMKACIPGNGDCRDGYVCRPTGTLGAEPVPNGVDDAGVPVLMSGNFCAQAN